jgi:hypothetical protein
MFGSFGKVAHALAWRSGRSPDRPGHPNSQLGSSMIPVWDRVSLVCLSIDYDSAVLDTDLRSCGLDSSSVDVCGGVPLRQGCLILVGKREHHSSWGRYEWRFC